MLVLLLYNAGGYMLMFQYLIRQADDFANEQISKGLYKPDELVEIKIPVKLPNTNDQGDFQAIAGQVKLNNNDYNYVAMKMTHDTMFLMCIPNYEKTRLVDENIITAKNVSDTLLAKKNHAPIAKKAGVDKDYNYAAANFVLLNKILLLKNKTTDLTEILITANLSTPERPPETQSIPA